MVKHTEHTSKFGMVPIASLNVDPEAQRPVSMSWVKARTHNFDPDQVGYILVNKRPNGKTYIVDGQHRVELMRAIGWSDQNIPAEVFDGLTQAQEAKLFNARNDRKSVTPYHKFRISVTAGDPEACDIDRIVRAHGLIVTDKSDDGNISAVASLQRVYRGAGLTSAKEGPAALGKSLTTLVQSWGRQSSSVNGEVIQGLGMLFLRYNGSINEKDLVKKLAPFPGGAPGVLGKGRAIRELRGRPVAHCIASLVVDIYNKGRKNGKLDAWES